MSTAPLARDADLRRLLGAGYDVRLDAGHLVVRHVPYVTQDRHVELGFLAYPVVVSGERLVPDTDHRIWFGSATGQAPCDELGRPLTLATPEVRFVSDGLQASFMLSSKPPAGYPDQYEKVSAYARILSHPAASLDPTATATPGGAWQEVEDDLPFRYRDTASSRAGLGELNRVFRSQRVVIVGLGGTGGYILDQVAKTPVEQIVLVDGDVFDNHNAFRAPGAASLDQLRARPTKADYFAALYGQMHTNVQAESAYLTEANLDLLEGATFVFLALDDAEAKAPILARLLVTGVPFIDVGLGVEEIDGRLSGLLRTVFVAPHETGHPQSSSNAAGAVRHIPRPAEDRDDYDRNIQIADLNALNAVLAVLRWKRHLGFYADATAETLSTYSIFTNEISNEVSDEIGDEPSTARTTDQGDTSSGQAGTHPAPGGQEHGQDGSRDGAGYESAPDGEGRAA